MSNFGYTMLGFGGGKNEVPIAADVIAAEADCEATTQINVQNNWAFDLDPFNENKILALYRDDGTYGNDLQVVCGTIAADGSTVTWGSIVECHPRYGNVGTVSFDPNTENSFIVAHTGRNTGNQDEPTAQAGTLSGTTITLGSGVDSSWCTSDDQMNHFSCIFNPSQAGQVCSLGGNYGGASCGGGAYRMLEFKVFTVSGTTVTHVSSQIVDTNTASTSKLVWDKVTPNKGYIFTGLDSTYPHVIPFTMSGNTPTFGTKQVTNSVTCGEYQMGCTMQQAGKLVHYYKSGGHTHIRVGNDPATDSTGTIVWGDEVVVSDFEDEGSHLQLYPTIQSEGWSGNTLNSVILGYNIPVSGDCSRWMIGTLSGDDTITIGASENFISSHSGTPDINMGNGIVADPFNPGRIYSGHSYTGNSSATMLVRHQLPSFEL